MSGLVRVELTRLRWRRAAVLLVLAAVVVASVVFAVTAWNTRPATEADRQRVERLIERETQQPYTQRELRKCLKHPERYGVDGTDVQAGCEDMTLPQPDWFGTRPTLSLDDERSGGSGLVVATILAMLLLLLGATFAGHDWNSGSMSNQLLFEPRRARVWAAKAVAVLLAGLVVGGGVLLAFWGGLWGLSELRGLPLRDGTLGAVGTQVWRMTLVAALAGAGGYALTMLFRSTVATLGVLFALSVLAPVLISLVAFPGHQRVLPQNNFVAVATDGYTVEDWDSPECQREDRPASCSIRISAADGAAYGGALLLLAGVPSVLSFRRRDVP
jgi:hypothetical protein